MRILAALPRYAYGDPLLGPSHEHTHFLPALEQLGHEVSHFDTLDTSRSISERGAALLAEVRALRPDVVVFVLVWHEVPIELLEEVRAAGPVTMNWFTDDSFKWLSFSRFVAPHLDVVATTYASAYGRYRSSGHPGAFKTQWATVASRLRPPLPARECRFDVTFVGSAHGDRRTRIAALQRAGVSVRCFGRGWQDGVVGEAQKTEIVRHSRISLNFANSSLDWSRLPPRAVPQLKARVFEVPGSGGFLLTEAAPDTDSYYKVAEEIATFRDRDELVAQVRLYLGEPALRDRVALAGFARTEAEHTYERRFAELLAFAATVPRLRPSPPGISARGAPPWLRPGHRALRTAMRALFGKRGERAARRLLFELGWRLQGARQYTSEGWLAQLYPFFPALAAERRR